MGQEKATRSPSLTPTLNHGDAQRNPNPTSSGGDDPADGAGGRREACASGGACPGSVPAKSDGVLQGFQRPNPEIQGRDANGGDDNGVHRQHVRVHGEVAVGNVVPEESGGDRDRERAGGARERVDNHGEARVRDREDQAERPLLPVHVAGVHLQVDHWDRQFHGD